MKLIADGKPYDFPTNMDMGELRLMKRHFDLARPHELDVRNIDHVAGLLFVAMKRANKTLPVEALMDRVDSVSKLDIEAEEGDEPEQEDVPARPTKAAPKAKPGK